MKSVGACSRRLRPFVMVENAWWIDEWGNPCRECGFDWTQSPETVIAAVEALPDEFDALLAGRTGDEQRA